MKPKRHDKASLSRACNSFENFVFSNLFQSISWANSVNSRTIILKALLLGAHLTCQTSWLDGQTPNIVPSKEYATVASNLSRFIETEIRQKKIDAFSIALIDGDQIVWAQGFGIVDAATNKAATAQSIYRVGSVSKLLNDVAVMQLVEQGRFVLDDDIRKLLPDFAPANSFEEPITLRQLMNHESGLVRESPVGNYFDPTGPSLAETIDSLNKTKVLHAPGSKTKYSNAAVSVAGYAVERVLGLPFAQVLKTNVLDPIGMVHSSFELDESIQAELATGMMWSYDGRRFEAPRFALGTLPAGNLYSSVLDLAQFMRLIFNEGRAGNRQVLSPEILTQMLQQQTLPDGQQRSYGIGFRLGTLEGHSTFEHGGAVYGYATQFRGVLGKEIGVVAVASLDVANGFVSRVADDALRLMLATKSGTDPLPQLVSTESIDRTTARQMAGLYSNGKNQVRLFESGGRLMMQGGTYDNEIRRLGERMVVDDVQAFGPFVEWSPEKLIFQDAVWSQVPDVCPKEAPPQWAGLIGEYGWDHNTLFIYEDNGQLWTLIEWVFRYPLNQVSENVFAFPEYGLYHDEHLVFSRDGNGTATKVVAAEVEFARRGKGLNDSETFKIAPLLPPDRLREIAMGEEPPSEARDFLAADLVALTSIDDTIKLDIRYATTNNFMDMVFYNEARAFMQRPAANALGEVQKRLREKGYGLLVHDAYRPWFVTKMFWEATPLAMRHFVANPENGSRHNRGCAVDLTLYDLKTDNVIRMVSGYDEFSGRAYPEYAGGTSRQRWHRRLLRTEMESAGFDVYEFEWWHFDYPMWKNYPILNLKFDEIE